MLRPLGGIYGTVTPKNNDGSSFFKYRGAAIVELLSPFKRGATFEFIWPSLITSRSFVLIESFFSDSPVVPFPRGEIRVRSLHQLRTGGRPPPRPLLRGDDLGMLR
jgi:hypothetical protein